jgi:hypothetical protein
MTKKVAVKLRVSRRGAARRELRLREEMGRK